MIDDDRKHHYFIKIIIDNRHNRRVFSRRFADATSAVVISVGRVESLVFESMPSQLLLTTMTANVADARRDIREMRIAVNYACASSRFRQMIAFIKSISTLISAGTSSFTKHFSFECRRPAKAAMQT